MKRIVATALVAAQVLLFSGCSGGGTPSEGLQANQDAMFAPAPCPSPGEMDALAGIEGYAPGAGGASKIGSGSQQSMGGGMGGLGGGSDATPTEPPTTAPSGGCRSFNPRLASTLTKLAADRAKLPTTGYDVAARAALYSTPEAAFAFVRDAIHTDGYSGSMRGSRGTLNAAAGSPADKSLLLRDLLSVQNVPTRLVHATLGDADATRIVATAQTPSAIAQGSLVADDRAVKAIADGIDVAKSSLGSIRSLLDSHHLALATGPIAPPLENVRDHWWLQAQIDGTWTDLDPTLPGTKVGAHLGPAPGAGLDALPAATSATITVRLLADNSVGPMQTLAEASTTSADAFEQPITVAMNGAADDVAAIAKQTTFVPTVSIGSTGGDGASFAPDGAARLRAIYLETSTTVPGRAPIVRRQTIVDRRGIDRTRVDAAWTPARTAYALTFVYKGIESVGDLDTAYAVGVNTDAMLRGALATDYAAQHPGQVAIPEAATSEYPYEAHRFFGYDRSIRDAMRASDPSLVWAFDHPLFAFYRQSFDLHDGAVGFVQSFDIVDNAVVAFSKGALAADRNAERGLMDTSVEGALVSGPGTRLDTAAVFAAAKGQTLAVLQSGDVASAPAPSRDALGSGLTATTVAIAPSAAVVIDGKPVYGWIEVDTSTGNLVGRMQSGEGQEFTEQSVLQKILGQYSAIKAFGRCINCFFSAFGESIVSDDKDTTSTHFLQCAANAMCQYAVDAVMDYTLEHGLEMEGSIAGGVTGPGQDVVGEVVGGTINNAICDNLSEKNPYSRRIIG